MPSGARHTSAHFPCSLAPYIPSPPHTSREFAIGTRDDAGVKTTATCPNLISIHKYFHTVSSLSSSAAALFSPHWRDRARWPFAASSGVEARDTLGGRRTSRILKIPRESMERVGRPSPEPLQLDHTVARAARCRYVIWIGCAMMVWGMCVCVVSLRGKSDAGLVLAKIFISPRREYICTIYSNVSR